MGRLAKVLSDFGSDGYFAENVILPDQSYLAVYVKNASSQPSDDVDGYEYEVLGLLDSGRGNDPDHANWFQVAASDGLYFHGVNGPPKKFDVSLCSRVRVYVVTTIGSDTISFTSYVKGG